MVRVDVLYCRCSSQRRRLTFSRVFRCAATQAVLDDSSDALRVNCALGADSSDAGNSFILSSKTLLELGVEPPQSARSFDTVHVARSTRLFRPDVGVEIVVRGTVPQLDACGGWRQRVVHRALAFSAVVIVGGAAWRRVSWLSRCGGVAHGSVGLVVVILQLPPYCALVAVLDAGGARRRDTGCGGSRTHRRCAAAGQRGGVLLPVAVGGLPGDAQ